MSQNRIGLQQRQEGRQGKVEGRVRRKERTQTVAEHIKISFSPKVQLNKPSCSLLQLSSER